MNRPGQIFAIAVAVMIFGPSFVSAQTAEQIERTLLANLKSVQKLSAYTGERNEEGLEKANADLKANLLKFAKIRTTLNYAFPKLNKEMYVATSADRRFRTYTWDREDGGTMHFFETVYQYIGDDKQVYSRGRIETEEQEDGGDAGGFVLDIFTLDNKGKKVYLVSTSSILSTSEMAQSIDLFEINGAVLNEDVKLIKTAEGLTHWLGFEFDFFSVVDRPDRPLKLISYDNATRTISIPVVIVEKKFQYGRVTSKKIRYRFNGSYFVKVS